MCMEFAAAGWYIGKYFRLHQTIRDLSCGNLETLLVVIHQGGTGLEKTELVCFQDWF